jgi:hypothetical protein
MKLVSPFQARHDVHVHVIEDAGAGRLARLMPRFMPCGAKRFGSARSSAGS